MKKVIFMLAAGALALSSCSETEVLEQGTQSNAIGFTNHVSKGTRAITDTDFKQFFVYGSYTKSPSNTPVIVFSGQEVKKVDNVWTYSPVRNWIPGAKYTFAAYATDNGATLPGVNAKANYGPEGNACYLNLANVEIDGDHQLDIVYAKPNKSYEGIEPTEILHNEIVALEFKHILSRLDFTFQSALPEGFNAVISKARLVSVRNIGLFNGEDLLWENVDRTVAVKDVPEIQLSIADGELTGEKNVTTGYAYVIPFNYTVKNVGIKFKITITDSQNNVITDNKEVSAYWAPKWAKNNTYSYKVIINGSAAGLEPIKFTGSVENWTTGEPATPEFGIDPEPLPAEEP